MSTDFRPIENDGSGPNEAFVADSACMNNRTVRHRDPITDRGRILGRAVNHNIVL
jgi:hypothetical protein